MTLVYYVLEKILENNQNVTQLHKELVEINLSITAYVQESKTRLETQRLYLAQQAKSSQEVVDILSKHCKCMRLDNENIKPTHWKHSN